MAPKNSSRFLDNPPSPSPDLEEEEEDESSSEEEEEVEEELQTPQKTLTKTHHQQKPKSTSSSEEEEEEGSGSDDDGTKSSPKVSDFTIKPVATKNATKKNSKESTKPSSKRSLDLKKDDEKKGPIKKKSKLGGAENGEETKRVAVISSGGGAIFKVWSDDDEIAVLKGMIDYESQKGADPGENLMDFLEFVKGKIHFDVTKTQLYEKIRAFKKKFLNNVKKADKGQDPVFSKPHEYSCFELAKKIWGKLIADGEILKINGGKVKKSGKVKSSGGKAKEAEKKKTEAEEEEEEEEDDDNMIVEKEVVKDEVVAVHDVDFSSKYRYLSESYDVRDLHMSETLRKFKKENISLIDEEKAKELDEKWKKLRLQEIELFSKRSRLMIEQAKLVTDAMKKM